MSERIQNSSRGFFRAGSSSEDPAFFIVYPPIDKQYCVLKILNKRVFIKTSVYTRVGRTLYPLIKEKN